MQFNHSYSAPAIARQNTGKDVLHTKKIFGAQAGGTGRNRINAEHEREYAETLKASEEALQIVDNNIKKALKLVDTFNKFVISVKRIEKKRALKREQQIAQNEAFGKATLWKQSLNTRPEDQEDHEKICALLLAQYKAKLDDMFATGHMKKLWDIPGSHAHLIPKAVRDTVSYRPNRGGRGEPSLDFGVFTDISEELRRRIARWDKLNLPAFDTSGPRLPPLILSASANVDTAGMQIRMNQKYWGHRGVKFNDIDRDTMAFAKAVAPQGAPRYYNKKSTLDQIHEYRFPFKCTGERFGNDDLTEEQIIMLGDSGGGATLAAARRRKGAITSGVEHTSSKKQHAEGDRALNVSTLGVTTADPLDDEDLGLPTDYLRRLEPYERHNTMKSKALQARLKGPSPSFLSKVKRDELPVYLRKEVFPGANIGLSAERMAGDWNKRNPQMFTKGPSGRERPGIPFVRTSAKKGSRIVVPETMEEYTRMKKGLRMKKKKTKQQGAVTSNVRGGRSTMLDSGGSALIDTMSSVLSSKGPSMPSRVPGDSMVEGSGGVPEDDDDDDDMMLFDDDMDDDNGEDELYAAMAAEASLDAHVSFENSSFVDADSLLANAEAAEANVKSINRKKSYASSTSTLPPGHSMISFSSSKMSSSAMNRKQRRRKPVGMQITIRSPGGAYVSLRVTPLTTISEIRNLIKIKSGLSSKIRAQLEGCSVMIFKKKVLAPGSSLKHAGVSNGSTLQALQYW